MILDNEFINHGLHLKFLHLKSKSFFMHFIFAKLCIFLQNYFYEEQNCQKWIKVISCYIESGSGPTSLSP